MSNVKRVFVEKKPNLPLRQRHYGMRSAITSGSAA